MMTEQEYKRNLIRMFDSLRTEQNEYRGEEHCKGVKCDDCPLFKNSCYGKWAGMSKFRVYEAIEIVENWAEQHPIKTNADKFREVFGIEPYKHSCVNVNMQCGDCKYLDGSGCAVSTKFWDAEYKEQTMGHLNGLV